ncbi:MAG TPA: GDSL-type esterase/lipase family protein, partial [Acidimicrobiales bacterium]|nr:GDSL-type esterase/lipase family protein [Acidimicrobiales bacterium]
AAYVTPLARRAATPVVFAGDSITADSATGTTGHMSSAGAAAIGLYPVGSVGVATGVSDAGVGGNTSTQLLARFDTDVIAKNPKLVHILIGTNDASADTPLATLAANIRAMIAKCEGIGAQVVMGTVPPNGTGSPVDRKALIVAYNQWICRYAISKGFPVADYYRVLVDPATGGYLAAYDSGDHTHPSPAGTGAMAAELAVAIARPLSSALLLTKDANDPWNFCRNGLFLSAWGTGWTAPTGTGVTASTTTGDTNIQGNWGKIVAAGTAATAASSQNQTTTQGGTGYTAGHRMMFGARVQSSALSSAQTWSARVRTTDGAYDLRPGPGGQRIAYTGAGGLVYLREGAAAPTVSYVQSEVELAAGTGDVSVAQFTAYDLTAMGVTDTAGNLI